MHRTRIGHPLTSKQALNMVTIYIFTFIAAMEISEMSLCNFPVVV